MRWHAQAVGTSLLGIMGTDVAGLQGAGNSAAVYFHQACAYMEVLYEMRRAILALHDGSRVA